MADKVGNTKIFSNKRQLDKLVAIMEKNPNIARGILKKSEAQIYWAKYSTELNSLGPPEKTPDKWAKVWIDLKAKVKKKLIKNKTEMRATGGGPNSLPDFSPVEETIIQIIDMNTSVDPPGQEYGLCDNKEKSPDIFQDIDQAQDENLENFRNFEAECEQNREKVQPPRKKQKLKEIVSQNLLIDLVQKQQAFYDNVTKEISEMKNSVKNISEYSKKQYYIKKDLLKLKKEKLRLYNEEVENKRKDRINKLRIKQELLELKKKECEMKTGTNFC